MADQDADERIVNPYATPSIAVEAADEAWDDLSEDNLLRTFVGRRAPYYLQKWSSIREGGERRYAGFNLAAFFLSGIWLGYRKMYMITFAFYGIILLESLVEDVVVMYLLDASAFAEFLGMLVSLAAALVCGMYGNVWYLRHAQGQIAQAQQQGLDGAALIKTLRRRGGTSLAVSLGLLLLFFVVNAAIFGVLYYVLYGPELEPDSGL